MIAMNVRIEQFTPPWLRKSNRSRMAGCAVTLSLLALILPSAQVGCVGNDSCTLIGCEGYYQLEVTDVDLDSLDGLHVAIELDDGGYIDSFD